MPSEAPSSRWAENHPAETRDSVHRDKWPSLIACPSGNRWCTKYVGHGTHPRTKKTHVNLEHVASSVVGGSTDVALVWLVGEHHETERRDTGADAVGGRGLPRWSGKSKGARWKELRKPRDAIPKAAATAPPLPPRGPE